MSEKADPSLDRPARFSTAFASSDNALNTLRLALAFLVIVSHTGRIAGVDWPKYLQHLGDWSVDGFFIISGYLILGSRLRSSWWSYSLRRLARIVPAFWVVTVITAVVFAPIAAAVSTSTWSPGAAGTFIVHNLPVFQVEHSMAGIEFPHFPLWNGSSWTLRFELFAYAGCLLLGSLGWVRRHVLPAAVATWVVSTLVWLFTTPFFAVNIDGYLPLARLGSFFAAGMVAFALREKIVVRWGYVIAAGAVVAALYPLGLSGEQLVHVPLTYLILGLGALWKSRVGAENDISYGIYIFAFPLQQMMAFFGVDRWGGFAHLTASTAATVLFATASWFVIEKPAMNATRRLIAIMRGRAQTDRPPGSRASRAV